MCIHIRKSFNVRQYGAKKETGKCIEDGETYFQMYVLLLFRFSEADRQVRGCCRERVVPDGGTAHTQPRGAAAGQVRRQKPIWLRGEDGQELLGWFPWERQSQAGSADLELADVNSSRGLWGVEFSPAVWSLALGW